MDVGGSNDPDGNITSYSWTQTAGPPVTLNGADTVSPTFTASRLSSDNKLKFSLKVKDDKDATSSNPATVTVTVKGPAPLSAVPFGSNDTSGGNMTSAYSDVGDGATYSCETYPPSITYRISWTLEINLIEFRLYS